MLELPHDLLEPEPHGRVREVGRSFPDVVGPVEEIIQVADIPRTISGKITEIAVREARRHAKVDSVMKTKTRRPL